MGHGSSKLDKVLDSFPESERYFGLENFGNTCYANSVLQSLYYCQPFREKVLNYANHMPLQDNLLVCLAELFSQINAQKRRTGVIAPKRFVQRLKKDNELFRSYQHQDAHEFLNYLLNECSEILEKEEKEKAKKKAKSSQANGVHENSVGSSPDLRVEANPATPSTWVHELFQGTLVNETRCLRCETVTSREEAFYDLSLEIEHNSSLSACLRNFSSLETLDADDKFFCDTCQSYQEAQKRMKIKRLPLVLCLHLKRFKYIEQYDRMRKLMYRVVYPLDLKLRNTSDDCEDADETYQLFSVVVHVGSGPNHGHYVTFVKSHDRWLFFDDDQVEAISESQLQTAFGSPYESNSNCMDHGYILMYDRSRSDQ